MMPEFGGLMLKFTPDITLLVLPSMTETVPDNALATYMMSVFGLTAMLRGLLSTGIVAMDFYLWA
jgi:hypothetical protein